jgi:hypothetical protein
LPTSAVARADELPAAPAGGSSSAEANATRALFDRFGTDSGASTFSLHQGDGQAPARLTAFSVDELFGDTSGVAESDFA